MEEQYKIALGQLDRVLGFMPRAENRATFLFGVNVGMFGVLAAKFPVEAPLGAAAGAAALAAALLALSTWRTYGALFPQLEAPDRPSVLYFGEIAKLSEADYIARLSTLDEATLLGDAASQVWRNAEILGSKFSHLKAGFRWTLAALVPWLLFLTLMTLQHGRPPVAAPAALGKPEAASPRSSAKLN